MKLVTTALEWAYADGDTEVRAEKLERAAELLVLRRNTLRIIDGAGPSIEDPPSESTEQGNGTGSEQEAVQTNVQAETGEMVEEQAQTSTSPNCTFSGELVPSHRSQTIYRQWHQPGGMPWLWKNAFSLPKQGRPPVQSAHPTQAADSSDRETLVGHRKNRLGCCRRVRKHLKSRGV